MIKLLDKKIKLNKIDNEIINCENNLIMLKMQYNKLKKEIVKEEQQKKQKYIEKKLTLGNILVK